MADVLVPFSVSATGLVHAVHCRLADGEVVYARREEALRNGRRLALCCLADRIDTRGGGPAWF